MRLNGAATAGAHRLRVEERNNVTAHGRPPGAGSIGLRLLLPITVASLGLVVGGVVQVAAATTEARNAHRAKVLADATAASVRFVDQIEQEVAETNALRERGGKAGAQLLSAQRARTDRALSEYAAASRAAVTERPALARPTGHVTNLLDDFQKARDTALDPNVKGSGLGDAFEAITLHLLDLAAAVAEQVTDSRLANLARSAADVSKVKHLAAAQRDLLRSAFVRRELPPAQLVALAGLRANELARLSEFTHIADGPTRARYAALVSGPDVETANALRDAVLSSAGSPASLEVDADAWYVAQSGAMRGMRTVQLELTTSLARTAQRQQSDAEARAVLAGFIATVVVLGTLTAGILLAVRTTRRLRRLRQTALAVARSELPIAVSQVATAGTSEVVRGAIGASHQRVASMMDTGVDEVAEVSAAIGVVHQQALRLAAEQALLRLEVSALFVALSRRGQSLVHRQLQLIDEFERTEEDPDNLARLFALDHLAARMRRNEENLLVLAGGEPGRRFEQPVVLTDVIRAAAAEIEDYKRVNAPSAEDVWVAAHAVGDVIHLLAELLDNAASFSPPSTRVRVTVARGGDSLTVSVVDSGIGMSDDQLVEGNRRLTRPAALTSSLVGTMGLLVVARLATRRGIRVKLFRNATGGTTAEVRLHTTVLVDAPPRAIPRPVRAAVAAPMSLPPVSVSAPRVAVPVSAPPVSAPPVRLPTPPVQITLFAAPTAAPAAASAPTPVSGPPARKKVPVAEEAMTAAGEPVVDALPGRTPATVPASGAPDPPQQTRTAAGLPLRRPGAHVDGAHAARRTPDDVFLDPETVRARLTSLAGGIAAAKRIVEAPPGASPLE